MKKDVWLLASPLQSCDSAQQQLLQQVSSLHQPQVGLQATTSL